MSRLGKSIWLGGCWGRGEGAKRDQLLNGYGVPFCGDENVLELGSGDGCIISWMSLGLLWVLYPWWEIVCYVYFSTIKKKERKKKPAWRAQNFNTCHSISVSPQNFSEERSKEIELASKDIPTEKSPERLIFTGKLYQIFKEEIIPILHNLVPKIEEEGTLLNSFYGATVSKMRQRPHRKRKLQTIFPCEHRYKNS